MGSWTIVFLLVNFLILECQSQCWSYDSALMTHVLISGSSSCLTVQPIPNNLKNLKAFKLDLRMNATLIAFMDRLPATIEVLDLGGNLISNVPANFFQKFGGSLKKLSLWRNTILTLDPLAFNGLSQLTELDLSRNLLTEIPESLFFGATSLNDLDLMMNQLSKLPDLLFRDQPPFTTLILESNKFLNMSSTLMAVFEKIPLPNLSLRTGFWYGANPWKCDPSIQLPHLPKCGESCSVPMIKSIRFTFPHYSYDPTSTAYDIFVNGCGFKTKAGSDLPLSGSIVLGNTLCYGSSTDYPSSSNCLFFWGFNEIRIIIHFGGSTFNKTIKITSESYSFTFPTPFGIINSPNISDYSEFMESWNSTTKAPSSSASVSQSPTNMPSVSQSPTSASIVPTKMPSAPPSVSQSPTSASVPTKMPSVSQSPSLTPTSASIVPTKMPSVSQSLSLTPTLAVPTKMPSASVSKSPTTSITKTPSSSSSAPSVSQSPTLAAIIVPTKMPSTTEEEASNSSSFLIYVVSISSGAVFGIGAGAALCVRRRKKRANQIPLSSSTF